LVAENFAELNLPTMASDDDTIIKQGEVVILVGADDSRHFVEATSSQQASWR
jgi:uncharacterized protein with PhoU and TrkA domain